MRKNPAELHKVYELYGEYSFFHKDRTEIKVTAATYEIAVERYLEVLKLPVTITEKYGWRHSDEELIGSNEEGHKVAPLELVRRGIKYRAVSIIERLDPETADNRERFNWEHATQAWDDADCIPYKKVEFVSELILIPALHHEKRKQTSPVFYR